MTVGAEVVAATLAELRIYVARTRGARLEVEHAYQRLYAAVAHLQRELPQGYRVPDPPDIHRLLGRLADIDDYVGEVAERFERAGEAVGGGRFRLSDAALAAIPFEAVYSQNERRRLQRQVEDELATLRERIRSGDFDETTAGELVALLDLMRHLIETAENPQAQAAALIDRMGPLDLHEALSLLEDAARDVDDLDADAWPIRGIDDLAFVVGLGLQDNPERAHRWAATLFDGRGLDRDWKDFPFESKAVEGPALLAARIPPSSQVFTLALFDRLFDAPIAPRGGLLDRLHGTTAPTEPVLRKAAKNPALANGIVHLLLDSGETVAVDALGTTRATRLDVLFGTTGASQPRMARDVRFLDIPESLLGDVLVASVHPSLDVIDRGKTAQALTGHYIDVAEGDWNHTFSGEVTRGFAAATQPLLEAWQRLRGDDAVIFNPGPGEVRLSDDHLWKAVGLYGTNASGVEGLAYALEGATTRRLLDAYNKGVTYSDVASAVYPMHSPDLDALNVMYKRFASAISGQRFNDIVNQLEVGATGEATLNVLRGLAGELHGGSALTGVIEALGTGPDHHVTGGANPLRDMPESVATLVALLDLEGRPRLATQEVQAAISEARDSLGGIYRLLTDDDRFPLESYGGAQLAQLRELVRTQLDIVDPFTPEALVGLTSDN